MNDWLMLLQALGCLADMVRQSRDAHQRLLSARVTGSKTGAQIMLLQAVLRAALYSDDQDEQPSAAALLAAFCHDHPEGQEALAATVLPTTRRPEPGALMYPRMRSCTGLPCWELQVEAQPCHDDVGSVLLQASAVSDVAKILKVLHTGSQPNAFIRCKPS